MASIKLSVGVRLGTGYVIAVLSYVYVCIKLSVGVRSGIRYVIVKSVPIRPFRELCMGERNGQVGWSTQIVDTYPDLVIHIRSQIDCSTSL